MAETLTETGLSNVIKKRIEINPEYAETERSIAALTQLDQFTINTQAILENKNILKRRAEDWLLFETLQSIINREESADAIILKLNALLNEIKKYDPKMAQIIQAYLEKRQDMAEILQFIYRNIHFREGLRVLFVNIKIVIEKVEALKDKSLEPLRQRLLLLEKIFDRIRTLEKDFDRIVGEQEHVILGLIRTIELGISNGSWEGFLGPKGLGTNTELYTKLFKDTYENTEFAKMLERNKQKYGESKPERWLGERIRWQEWPDSLWFMYNRLRPTMTQRLNLLWQNAARIAESIKILLEQYFGSNPSIALADVKKRMDVLERNIENSWRKKKKTFDELVIAARLEYDKVERIINQIKGMHAYINKWENLAGIIQSNLNHQKQNQQITSIIERRGFLTHLLLLIGWNAKKLEENVISKEKVIDSIHEQPKDDEKSFLELKATLKKCIISYRKLIRFIESLNIGIKVFNNEPKTVISGGVVNG